MIWVLWKQNYSYEIIMKRLNVSELDIRRSINYYKEEDNFVCRTCGIYLKRRTNIKHVNIENDPPLLLFCSIECRDEMLELMRKYPDNYLKKAYEIKS